MKKEWKQNETLQNLTVRQLTKSLCNSLFKYGLIFSAPMKMKNSPNSIDKLFSTIVEPALVVGLETIGLVGEDIFR